MWTVHKSLLLEMAFAVAGMIALEPQLHLVSYTCLSSVILEILQFRFIYLYISAIYYHQLGYSLKS